MSEHANREKEVFNEALELHSPQARQEYLAKACGQDPELRRRVEVLLRAYDSAAHFIPERSGASGEIPAAPSPGQLSDAPGTAIGCYTLLKRIGEGGFGSVYLAEQREPVRRRVALKIVKLGMDTSQVIARFASERQALARMDHPNIAKVFDAGTTMGGRPYFVMELVDGVAITKFCDQNNLSRTVRLELFMQVCRAVQHAHQKGIIHRDIKPSNILVTLHDGLAVPKVIDFGIAKASQQQADGGEVTQLHQFLGTPAYMSPEQAALSGVDLDTRSDIYSLGVLLYELLVGQPPFDAQELLEAGFDEMRRVLRERQPVRPSIRLKQSRREASKSAEDLARLALHPPSAALDPDLDWIVMKCLEKDRTRRYATANALAMDIQRHLHNEPVLARPPSAAYLVQKTVRRHRFAFAAAGAVTIMLLLGTAGVLWQWRRAEHQLYAARMGLAQAAWEQYNVTRVKQVLDETEAASASERGFEWFYWQRQLHLELQTLSGHLGPVLAVAFSPDGRQIVTGSADHTARVWQLDSNHEPRVLEGHTDVVSAVAFSPDGQWIVTGSWDRTAKIWDSVSGNLLSTPAEHSSRIYSVAVSPNGNKILTGGAGGIAMVWTPTDGEPLALPKHSNAVFSVAYSPDGQRMGTGSWDGTVRIWPATGGKELHILTNAGAGITSIAFSKDGRQLAAGGFDGKIRRWDVVTGQPLPMFAKHRAPVFSLAWSPDGGRILSGSMDQSAKLWDAAGGTELFTVIGHGAPIFSAVFSADGKRVATSGGLVAVSPDGIPFLIGGGPGTAKVWNADRWPSPVTLNAHRSGVYSAVFSPDGRRILTGSWDNSAIVWDADSGKELFALKEHTGPVHCVAYSGDGERFVTASFDGTAILWDAKNGTPLRPFHVNRPVSSVAFSPDNRRIITGGTGPTGTAMVWDIDRGDEPFSLRGHSDIYLVAFSPNGQRLLTGAWDGTARIWEAKTGKPLLFLRKRHNAAIRGGAFSPDGRRILLASLDGTATLWDASSGKLLFTLKGHGIGVLSAGFSPDGRRIVTGSGDQTAKVWEASDGLELLTLRGHNGVVFSAAFSPDGQRIVTAAMDRTVRVWDAASERQIAAWRNQEQHTARLLETQRRKQDGSR